MITEKAPGFDRFRSRRRRAVQLDEFPAIGEQTLSDGAGRGFLRVIEPAEGGVELSGWAQHNRGLIRERLQSYGAVLFRGFELADGEAFRRAAQAMCPDLLDYNERAAPRHEVGSKVYTSTEYPADQVIPLHHEMSYSHNFPRKLLFFCEVAPASGGRTPLVDDRELLDRIDPAVREPFEAKGVMYVRNYGGGLDLPWQEVFQTEERAEVEAYCRSARTEVEWLGDGRLRTRRVGPATLTHPVTGDEVWFNHAHLFHTSNLEPAVREALLADRAPDEVPRNAFYGDGSPIEDGALDHIRQLYESSALRFEWQRRDLLLVDNVLASHGREPFSGPRRILVAMAEPSTAT